MRVLHITNELTKKNYSIASLMLFVSKHICNVYEFKYSILTSKIESNLFDDKNISKIEINNWIDFFFRIKSLSTYVDNFNIVHIHGIWAPIQIFSILLCNLKRKKYIIHPHGMLLNEALRSAGLLKYLYKKTFLFFFKYLIIRNTFFVSITDQEKDAIKKYFPKSKITKIYNPIPFEKRNFHSSNKKKQFVYFGRIHPHKNLDILINAFKEANLGHKWNFQIYGIQDDKKYYDTLLQLIGTDSRIQIKEPVFEEKKQLILSESWLNLLLSKSEVLSLSILESSIYGLPSLANENIEIKNIEDSVLTSKTSISSIKDKLIFASQWTLQERLERGKNIYKNVETITSIDKISSKYNNLYNSLITQDEINENENKQESLLSYKNYKFLQITGTYMFNLMFSSFIVVALVVFGHFSKAGELGLVISFWISLTQIFSSNIRSIVISENRIEYAFQTLFYRIFMSIFFYLVAYFIILNFISFENTDLIILFSILILVQWVNEMSLVKSEVQKNTIIFSIYLFINSIVLILSILFIYFSYFDYLKYILTVYILFIIITIPLNYLNLNVFSFKLNLKSIYNLNLKTIAFLSSFSIVISSFAWRMMIYFTLEKPLAGMFFACFSIGSFPGTVFNSVIGPTFVKNKIKLSKNFKIFLFLIFILILTIFSVNFYQILHSKNIDYLNTQFIYYTISISLIGSYFMSYAMYLRHKKIQTSLKTRTDLFQTDIFYGVSITFLIPIMYYLGNIVGVSFSFFIASLIALISYSFNNKFKIYN